MEQSKLSEVDLTENFQLQLSEIEMLSSMYPDSSEFNITLPHILVDMERYISGKATLIPAELDFVWCLQISDHNVKLEVNVCFPREYPSSKPLLSARSVGLNRHQQRLLNSAVSNYIQSIPTGELCVISVLNWLTENASGYFSIESSPAATDIADRGPKPGDTLSRMWIYSHHIYNKFKRRDIVDSAQDLGLTGFSLPGKPGFICIEGTKRDCDEFVHGLKQLSWKKISLVREEREESGGCSLESFKKFDHFQEISFQVRRGPAKEYHMDMGQFLKYLEIHGCSYAFQDLFGIEGHASSEK